MFMYFPSLLSDIVDVTPRRGSMGGTKISITVSNSLVEYQDNVRVYVGGN
jgi:hypothetical protein